MTSIPDHCYGSGRISWSDDSYAYYNEPCPGCSNCTKEEPMISKREIEEEAHTRVAERRATMNPARVALTVSIPVTLGGYGQGDWEEYERSMKVAVDGDTVTLSDLAGQAGTTQIKFARSGIEAAVKILQGYKA